MYCPNCGKEVNEKALFCSECGTPISSIKKNKNHRTIEYSKAALYGVIGFFIVCIGIYVFGRLTPNNTGIEEKEYTDIDVCETESDTPNTEDIQEDDLVDKNDSNGELEQKENSDDNVREDIFPYEKDGDENNEWDSIVREELGESEEEIEDNSYLSQYASLLREYLYSTDEDVGIYSYYAFTASKYMPEDYKGLFALVDLDGDGREELLVGEYGDPWNVFIPGNDWKSSMVGSITTYDNETGICKYLMYMLDEIDEERMIFKDNKFIYLTPDDPEYYIDCQEIWVTDYYEITEENITKYCGE